MQWKEITDREDKSTEVPKFTKNSLITCWCGAFDDYLQRTHGVRNTPLSYVNRKIVNVPIVSVHFFYYQPHSKDHGSLIGEIIACLYHTSLLYMIIW